MDCIVNEGITLFSTYFGFGNYTETSVGGQGEIYV